MSHLQQGDRARNGNHRSEAPRPETRKLFCRSASVLGRPSRTEPTGLMHATLFTGDALRQIVRVYSRVGSVRRGRPRTVPLFLHSEAIFLYASGGSSRDTNAPCSFRRIVCVEIKDRMHTLLLYWTTIAIAISACCVNPVIGSSSLSKRLNLCRKSSERKRSDYAADYTHRLEVLSEVFEPREYFEWRGLGSIAHSGMKLYLKLGPLSGVLKEALTFSSHRFTDSHITLTHGSGGCEILGLDPLYVANEGKLVAIVSAELAHALVARMKQNKYGAAASIFGEVKAEPAGIVSMRTAFGGTRIVDMLVGEQLPRIC